MPKIIFVGDIKYPHGSASANYVQCLASAFTYIGYEAIVCSTVDESEFQEFRAKNTSITVCPLDKLGGGFKRLNNLRKSFFPSIEKFLSGYEFAKEDIIVSYAITPEISSFVIRYAKKRGIHSMICPVEWFDAAHYKGGILSYHYWVFARNFYWYTPKFDYIFSISTRIHSYFLKRRGNSLLIPCLVDTQEFEYDGAKSYDRVKILFPGTPGEKGAFSALVSALDTLDQFELNRFEIHLTRTNQKDIEPYLSKKLLDLENSLFIYHGWLSYAELVELYKNTNYLFLIREESHSTKSNFPSKGPEALTYGVIPIATRIGDFENNYLIDGYNSVIVNNTTSEIAEAFKRILRLNVGEYLELSKNARLTARERFDYHVWSEIIKSFIMGEKNA